MKFKTTTIYRTVGFAVSLAAVCILPVALAHAAEPAKTGTQFAEVHCPDVPSYITLCGKKLSLDRTDLYERYDRELTSMAYTHGTTTLIIKRANRYFPVMAPILEANGVPLDMLYLACVESSLNIRAYSGAKAAGLWQFMPATAKQYGLEVSDEVDERYDIEKATAAACRYLKNAYSKYGDWPSVMASYNGGMGRISSELEKQQVGNALDLYLTDETSRYPFRIMAMKAIMENPSEYGFLLSASQLYQPRQYKEVVVDRPIADWPTWAIQHGITYAELRDENPWIRAKTLTNKDGKSYTVKVPTRDSLLRSKQKRSVYNSRWIGK
jgi:hypothetical protein